MTNADVAACLREMALFLDMTGVPFKPRAYEKASAIIEELDRPVADLHGEGGVGALARLPGIGKGIAERIGEIIQTGTCRDLEELRRTTPVDAKGLTAISGIGPKMVKALYTEFGIRTVADLEEAARAGSLRNVRGFGAKTEANILKSITFLKQQRGRVPL